MCEFEVPMVGVQQGWQCPVCKRVYAPFVRECLYCGGNTVTNVETGTGQPFIDWCRHTSYTGTGMPEVTLNGTEFGSRTKRKDMEMLRSMGWSQMGEDKEMTDEEIIKDILCDGNNTVEAGHWYG